ncbi:MAG TPA: hypothetical protein VIY47_02465, partial [Ignavibacteriaceae bacterium]
MASQNNLWDEARQYGWEKILTALVPELKEAALARNSRGSEGAARKVTCPCHGTSSSNGRGNGFAFFPNFQETGGGICNTCGPLPHGNQVLAWVLQSREEGQKVIRLKDIKKEYHDKAEQVLGEFLRHGSYLNPEIKERIPTVNKDSSPEEKRQKLLAIRNIAEAMWKRSHEDHQMVKSYLKQRGQKEPEMTDFMRWGESIPYWIGVRVKYFDAFLLPIIRYFDKDNEKNMEVVGIHRIYLEEKEFKVSKAPVEEAKKMLRWGDLKGACIPLYPLQGTTLAVCEGVETATAI